MSLQYDLLMMGAVGRPLENISNASTSDGWFAIDDVQWSVERIGRRVYTFALDDVWAEPNKGDRP